MTIKSHRRPKTSELLALEWEAETGSPPTEAQWRFAEMYCAALGEVAARSGQALAECKVPGAAATIRGHKRYWKTVAGGLKWAATVAKQIRGRTNGLVAKNNQ
jgi:hypothetical protein